MPKEFRILVYNKGKLLSQEEGVSFFWGIKNMEKMERVMRFELTTFTLAR